MKTLGRIAFSIALAGFLLGACSQLNVGHLNRAPWRQANAQTLSMKYWTFAFENVALKNKFGVRGVAKPIAEAIPNWANWIEELRIVAYLSDARGQVLAKESQECLPRPLDRDKGAPFEIILPTEDIGDAADVFVTFGYRMVLSDAGEEKPSGGKSAAPGIGGRTGGAEAAGASTRPKIFFASEGALTKR